MTIRDTSAQDRPIAAAPWWRRRGTLLGAALIVVLVAALVAAAPRLVRELAAERSVSLARLVIGEVAATPLTRDVAGEGKVVAAVSPTLFAGSAGTVTLLVKAGDEVRRGQVVARIESAELAARLAQERANADAARSEWLRAEADARQQRALADGQLETAKIALETAQNDLRRQTQAFEAGATAGMQVDQARDAVARARVALKQAEATLGLRDDAARFEVLSRRQAWERQLLVVKDVERQHDGLAVRSPVDGQVGQLFVTDRASVARDARLATVIDLSQLEVQMQVAESFARELQPGMPGEISGGGQQWKGRVASVSPEVVNNEVAARLRFDGAQPAQLRQNQRLAVRVLLDHRERVLTVPRGSFVDEGGGRVAYVLQEGQAVRRAVRLGAQSLARVEVLEGLAAGEKVVISGAENFGGAERVTVGR